MRQLQITCARRQRASSSCCALRRLVAVCGVYVLLLWPLLDLRPAAGYSQASESAYREELVFVLPNGDRGALSSPLLSRHALCTQVRAYAGQRSVRRRTWRDPLADSSNICSRTVYT